MEGCIYGWLDDIDRGWKTHLHFNPTSMGRPLPVRAFFPLRLARMGGPPPGTRWEEELRRNDSVLYKRASWA